MHILLTCLQDVLFMLDQQNGLDALLQDDIIYTFDSIALLIQFNKNIRFVFNQFKSLVHPQVDVDLISIHIT